MLDQKDITYNEFRLAEQDAAAEARGHPPPRDTRAGPVLRRLRQAAARRPVRLGQGLRRRTEGRDHDRPRASRSGRAQAIAKWLPSDYGPAAALVALDPRDGRVLAMVGGDNYRESQFNLAVQGERQPGSSFKPFVLATALEQGISPMTVLESKPVTISLGDRNWYVHNYEGSNLGPIDLTTATVYSDNTVYAQLTQHRAAAQRRGDGATARHHPPRSTRTSRSASAPTRSARSRWPAPSRRSPNGGQAGRRLDLRQPATRGRLASTVRRTGAVERPRDQRDRRGDRQPDPPAGRAVGHRQASGAARRPAGRRQDRHDRELRRRLVRRLHAAARRRGLGRLPEHAAADADRVPRRGRRRRHVPGADLEELHGVGAPVPEGRRRRASRTPTSRRPSRGNSCSATARSSSTTASAANTIAVEYFAGREAGEDGKLQAERGRGAERGRLDVRRRRGRGSRRSR